MEKNDKYDVCILTKILFTHHRNSEQTQYWDPGNESSYFSSHQISSELPENNQILSELPENNQISSGLPGNNHISSGLPENKTTQIKFSSPLWVIDTWVLGLITLSKRYYGKEEDGPAAHI